MKNYILMADVIRSSQKNVRELMKDLKEIANKINTDIKDAFLSPITITLGDEFQCIVKTLKNGLNVILTFEELILIFGKNFKLRYVLNYGEIETPLNRDRAHGMMGKGLVETREMLETQKHGENRFLIKNGDPLLSERLNLAFYIYQSLIDGWAPRDYRVVSAFLEHRDYKRVAKILGKNTSLMWKREKSLKINEYLATRKLIDLLTG